MNRPLPIVCWLRPTGFRRDSRYAQYRGATEPPGVFFWPRAIAIALALMGSSTQAGTARDGSTQLQLVAINGDGASVVLAEGAFVEAGSAVRLSVIAPRNSVVTINRHIGDGVDIPAASTAVTPDLRSFLPAAGSLIAATPQGRVRIEATVTAPDGDVVSLSSTITVVQFDPKLRTIGSSTSEASSLTSPLTITESLSGLSVTGKLPQAKVLASRPEFGIVRTVGFRPTHLGERLRGPIEVELFRKWSSGVVLISPRDGSLGSGAVIDLKQRLIVTNAHVLEGAKTVSVIFKPLEGRSAESASVYQADLVRVDEVSDLALVRVRELPTGIPEMKLGRLEGLEIGSDVHAIGHPTGELWSYTKGLVSQIRPAYEWSAGEGITHQATVIQTQTPINPGNSGGPLMTDTGEIIGINSFVRADAQGVNYAVSVNEIRTLLAMSESRYARSQPPDDSVADGSVPAPRKAKRRKPNDEGGPAPNGAEDRPGRTELRKGKPPGCAGARMPIDINGDGSVDGVAVDSDCSGKTDTVVLDRNGDGVPDLVLLDGNEDGVVDAQVVDGDGNGTLELWLIDEDGNGRPDVAGVDQDGDGEADVFRSIARS